MEMSLMKPVLTLFTAITFLATVAILTPSIGDAQTAKKSGSSVTDGGSSTAKGSFKNTDTKDPAGAGGADSTVRTSTQGTDSKEATKPENARPKTSFQDTTTAPAGRDAGSR
jgi:hypothetical protein